MSDIVGRYVFLEGFCGRVEATQGDELFWRVDEKSMPGRVDEAREHFELRHEAGKPFPGKGMWADDAPVRILAFRWDSARRALRLKIASVAHR